jgi:ubiquinone/menaquinone biosynthesis C-methylase UbiE
MAPTLFAEESTACPWLDLGCGSGHLTALLWQQMAGRPGGIVSLDVNAANERLIARLRSQLEPAATAEQIRFVCADFSGGLPQLADGAFDGIVSGLAISYAEWRDPHTGAYTDFAYNRLLAEMQRVLVPGGSVVFSVNVPRARFFCILWRSLGLVFRLRSPGKAFVNALKMQGYGRWLNREAKRGRFHYLPAEEIEQRLRQAGFEDISYRLSYAGQAYLFSARKAAAKANVA